MYNTIFYIILAVLVFDFLLERFLEYLNTKAWSPELPEVLKGIYDETKYHRSQQYYKANLKLGIFSSTLSFLLILMMLFFGGFAWVDQLARHFGENEIIVSLVFFGLLGLAFDLIMTPFSLYDTFVIEEKFGFNKTTLKTFVSDKLKGWLLIALIGGGLLALIIWFYQLTGNLFWIWAWILAAVFMIFLSMFYSSLIVPLFNKQTPLKEGELKKAISDLCHRAGFTLNNVYVIDGSKRSTKANAYFSGLGKKKRVVLYDTLINDLETDEIVAVLAHEIGHYKKKHTLTGIMLSVLQTGLTFWLFSLFVGSPQLSQALGAEQSSFHLGLIAFGIIFSPVSTILGLGSAILSRRHEFQADAFAAAHSDARKLGSALIKLSVNNLSNLTPHPLYVFFHYSHPPLLERLRALGINKLPDHPEEKYKNSTSKCND
ncbi:MAG TPA: M48 family peptidase [Bacteroidetes bacterium]|nr:M48 family peptidase [Bacteroidota bacterium]